MAADRAGRRAGRVEQHGVERPGLPFARRRPRRSRPRGRGARDFAAAARAARRRAVDGGDLRAGGGKLRGLAAGRGAEIGDASCRARRRAAAPAAPRRRPAPTTRPRRSRAAAAPGPDATARTVPVGSTRPPSALAQCAGSSFTVRSSAGSWRVGDARWRARCRRRSARSSAASASPAYRARRHRGRASRCLPSRASRRSTALTRPA